MGLWEAHEALENTTVFQNNSLTSSRFTFWAKHLLDMDMSCA